MVQQASLEMPPQKQHHQKQRDENASPPLLGRHNQGVMVPADASSSTRSKQQQQQQAPSSDVAGDRTVEPLIVFDWDDTILTSSWIQVNELLQAGSYDELPLEVRRDLAQLERSVIKCLKNARQLGTVIIITNAESGWVELSAARFFVDVLPLLEGVPVISARSLFEPQFPGSPLCWKSAAFAYMMHDHFLDRPQWVQKKVVSIGDSNEEKVAMRIASGQHGTMAAKAVKFITGPDPEALSCQLDYVTKNLASVVATDSDVDIVLDASTIHGSYSLPLHSRGVYDDPLQQQQHQQHQHLRQQSSSSAPSTPFSCRGSSSSSSSSSSCSGTANPSPLCTTTPARPASSPQVCSTARSASASASPPDAAAGPATVAAAASCHDGARPSTAVLSSSSSSSSSSEGSAGAKGEEPTTAAFDQAGRRRSSSSRSGGAAGSDATTASSSSSSAPPSPQHLALKRRASSSPIPIPPAGHGPGHGRVGGGSSSASASASASANGKGSGSPGVEGGGDCAQPFPASPTEVGGPLSSYSSLSRAAAAERKFLEVSPSPTSSASCGDGDGEAMALSPVSLVDGGCSVRGGDGGGGAEGGCGTSAFGGGSPCPVDDCGVGGGGSDGTMEVLSGAAVVVEMGVAVGPKEIAADGDDDQGRQGMALSGGGCGEEGTRRGAAVDGMVGVVEAAVAVDTAPKA